MLLNINCPLSDVIHPAGWGCRGNQLESVSWGSAKGLDKISCNDLLYPTLLRLCRLRIH